MMRTQLSWANYRNPRRSEVTELSYVLFQHRVVICWGNFCIISVHEVQGRHGDRKSDQSDQSVHASTRVNSNYVCAVFWKQGEISRCQSVSSFSATGGQDWVQGVKHWSQRYPAGPHPPQSCARVILDWFEEMDICRCQRRTFGLLTDW